MKKAITKGFANKAYYIETVVDGAKRGRRKVRPYRNLMMTIELPKKRKDEFLRKYRSVRKPKIQQKSKKR